MTAVSKPLGCTRSSRFSCSSGAVVDALVRGLTKRGGELRLRSAVDSLLIDEDSGRCVGVRLASGEEVRARKAVVSNAPVWETAALLPAEVRAKVRGGLESGSVALDASTPPTPSFVHLHLGIRADGLTEQAMSSIHHISIPEWDRLMEPQVRGGH